MWSKSVTTLNPYEATKESIEREATQAANSESADGKNT